MIRLGQVSQNFSAVLAHPQVPGFQVDSGQAFLAADFVEVAHFPDVACSNENTRNLSAIEFSW